MEVRCIRFLCILSVILMCAWTVNAISISEIGKGVVRAENNTSDSTPPTNTTLTGALVGVASQLITAVGNYLGFSRAEPSFCDCSKLFSFHFFNLVSAKCVKFPTVFKKKADDIKLSLDHTSQKNFFFLLQ